MKPRKILIVAGESELWKLLVELCDALFVATVVIDSVDGAKAITKREQISEVITGSLHGEWKQIVKLARQQDKTIPVTLWATGVQYRRVTERMGVRFVDQDSFALLELIKTGEQAHA